MKNNLSGCRYTFRQIETREAHQCIHLQKHPATHVLEYYSESGIKLNFYLCSFRAALEVISKRESVN